MMSNAWRDPVWRAAFLLSARADLDRRRVRHARRRPTAPRGHATTRSPTRSGARPTFDIGDGAPRVSRPGSLLDGFCSRCHMPTNYVDNVPLHNVTIDPRNGHRARAGSTPTSTRRRTTAPGSRSRRWTRSSATPTRARAASSAPSATASRPRATRPFHNLRARRPRSPSTCPAVGTESRAERAARRQAGHLRPSPIRPQAQPRLRDRRRQLPPVAARDRLPGAPRPAGRARAARPPTTTTTSGVFGSAHALRAGATRASTTGYQHVLLTTRRDVRRLPRRDQRADDQEPARHAGWAASPSSARTRSGRAAATPIAPATPTSTPPSSATARRATCSRTTASPARRRRCTRTASPLPPLEGASGHRRPERDRTSPTTSWAATRYVPRMIGTDVDATGNVAALSGAVDRSASRRPTSKSPYSQRLLDRRRRKRGPPASRRGWPGIACATCSTWTLQVPATRRAGSRAPADDHASTNTGSGHNFPTGFPEGRIAWLARARLRPRHRHASSTSTTALWNRTSLGVGNLTTAGRRSIPTSRAATGSCPPARPTRTPSSSRRWRRWATAARRWTSSTPRR